MEVIPPFEFIPPSWDPPFLKKVHLLPFREFFRGKKIDQIYHLYMCFYVTILYITVYDTVFETLNLK